MVSLSGANAGRFSLAWMVAVIWLWPPPLFFITQMSERWMMACGVLANAIMSPLVDQAGSTSSAIELEILVWLLPSGSIVKICQRPVRWLANAIIDPSRDQAGWVSDFDVVICVRPVPSLFITKMFERSLLRFIVAKATCLP